MRGSLLLSLLFISLGLIACHGSSDKSSTNASQFLKLDKAVSGINIKGRTLSNASLANPNLNDVASNESFFVAVGDGGAIVYSTNGVTWGGVATDITEDLHSVSYNKITKLFYAVGDNGLVISSADGLTWNKYHRLQPANNLLTIYTKNGDTFIGAESGIIYELETSTPRALITVRELGDNNENITTVTGDDKDMMIIGTNKGDAYYKKYSQFKADNWHKSISKGNLNYSDMYYDLTDGTFIATSINGYVMRSKDGIQWSTPILAVVDEDKDFAIKSISVEPNTYKFY